MKINLVLEIEKYMVPCLSKKIFGLDCPGCGMQRSLLLVAKGEFSAACHLYPAIYTSILFAIFLGFHLLDKTRNYSKIVIFLAIANGIIMMASYLYKLTNF